MGVLKGSTKSQTPKVSRHAPKGRQGPTPSKRSRVDVKRGGFRR